MKRLMLLVALVMAMAMLAPAAFADDADDLDGADIEVGVKDPSTAQLWKAQMIADYFFTPPTATASTTEETGCETSVESAVEGLNDTLLCRVLDLRAAVGWGAVFKLMMYAQATGYDPWDIGPLAGDGGDGFGNLLKDVEFEGEFTNLGQLQKSYKVKPDKAAKPEKTPPPGQAKKSG